MNIDKLLKAIGTLDREHLTQVSDAVLEQHHYLNHDPMVYGVKRTMKDGATQYKIKAPLIVWDRGDIQHPRLWLVTTRKVAEREVRINENLSVSWADVTYEVFSIPKEGAILLPCYKTLKYNQQKKYMPR